MRQRGSQVVLAGHAIGMCPASRAHGSQYGHVVAAQCLMLGAAQGVPVEHRPFVWMAVSGALERKSKQIAGYFQAMTHKGEVDSEVAHQIELVRPGPAPRA